jgi:hypothetical protein
MITEQQLTLLGTRIAHLEGQVAFLYEHLGITYVPEARSEDDPRIIEALKQGNLIGAIKVYRELHNSDLNTARLAVEEIQGRLGL